MHEIRDVERDRLNRRIRILDKETARELKRYRNRISKHASVERRNQSFVFVPRGQSGFLEGADVVSLCHILLDVQGVPEDPDLNHPPLHTTNTQYSVLR